MVRRFFCFVFSRIFEMNDIHLQPLCDIKTGRGDTYTSLLPFPLASFIFCLLNLLNALVGLHAK